MSSNAVSWQLQFHDRATSLQQWKQRTQFTFT